MKEELIKLAKELGFESKIVSSIPWKYSQNEELRYCLWMCELQKWVRDIHNIDVVIIPNEIGYEYFIYNRYPPMKFVGREVFQHYEKALEAGIIEALKLINK